MKLTITSGSALLGLVYDWLALRQKKSRVNYTKQTMDADAEELSEPPRQLILSRTDLSRDVNEDRSHLLSEAYEPYDESNRRFPEFIYNEEQKETPTVRETELGTLST